MGGIMTPARYTALLAATFAALVTAFGIGYALKGWVMI